MLQGSPAAVRNQCHPQQLHHQSWIIDLLHPTIPCSTSWSSWTSCAENGWLSISWIPSNDLDPFSNTIQNGLSPDEAPDGSVKQPEDFQMPVLQICMGEQSILEEDGWICLVPSSCDWLWVVVRLHEGGLYLPANNQCTGQEQPQRTYIWCCWIVLCINIAFFYIWPDDFCIYCCRHLFSISSVERSSHAVEWLTEWDFHSVFLSIQWSKRSTQGYPVSARKWPYICPFH